MLSVAAVVYGSHRNLPIVSYQKQAAWVLYSTWVTSAVNDLVIAIMLVYGLHRQRVNAHMRLVRPSILFLSLILFCRTAAVLDKLVKWTIGSAKITLFL
jgi:hypothetical protein